MKIMIQLCEADTQVPTALIKALACDYVVGANAVISEDYTHILQYGSEGLSLFTNAKSVGKEGVAPTQVDFLDGGLQHRRLTSGKSQGIAKAVGLNKLDSPKVVDATAGLGKDSFILASLGCTMTLLERSPLIHALLEDGLRRGLASADSEVFQVLNAMTLINIDAKSWFEKILTGKLEKPDVIYLDPMFPPRGKSAKVKKDISLLQEVLGIDDDFDSLLAAARKCALHRVVVKRPGKRSKSSEPTPSFQIEGKSAHFDVFV